jgi:AraC family transcriptional regulator of adaptative response/methylated-DNA-[protein]-cysteine methyltransferase
VDRDPRLTSGAARAGTGERIAVASTITDVVSIDTASLEDPGSLERITPRAATDDPRVARVRNACDLIAERVGDAPSLTELADATGASPDALRRDFRRVLGVSPKQYADALRVERLRDELREGRDVTGAMYHAGYGSSSRLYEQSDARLGMTPASYGAGGAGAVIAFTVTESPLGTMLVAATTRGICRITLGRTEPEVEARLREEFHAAAVTRDDEQLAPVVDEVLRRIDGEPPHEALPVDMRGTAFQLRVWQELRRIPSGETRSYGEIAAAVGAPGGARAVGQACGSNPVAIVVPCHRVVAAGGGLGGYAWGLDAKRLLLGNERDHSPEPADAAD